MAKKAGFVRLQDWVSKAQFKEATRRAKSEGRSRSALVREALFDFLSVK